MSNTARYRHNRIMKRNAGFTLVELVVVLVLITILMGVTVFGGLAWQDWMRFQHEDSVAEEVFFTAQNQLVELDASGATDRKFGVLKTRGAYQSDYVLASRGDGADDSFDGALTSIIGSDGETYAWDTVWKSSTESGASLGLNVNQKGTRTILKLSAKSGDYDRYLAYQAADATRRQAMLESTGDDSINLGTVLLFDLIAPYISDVSALNGAILLELSPETGQVFSALYSDRADELTYGDSGTSVLDRRTAAREPLMLGYYGVDQLTERIRGKGVEFNALRLLIRNEETLELALREMEDGYFDKVSAFNITVYDGDEDANDSQAMTFSIPKAAVCTSADYGSNDPLIYAAEHPVCDVAVTFSKGAYSGSTYNFRFPAWIDSDQTLHIILDGADVQAQTSIYEKAIAETDKSATDSFSERFRNTFSFYRFGLAGEVNYIYASVNPTLTDSGDPVDSATVYSSREVAISGEYPTGYAEHKALFSEENAGSCGECAAFASYALTSVEEPVDEESGTTITVQKNSFEIANARHFYNMRYETECKQEGAKDNLFTLTSDIDWNVFVGKTANPNKDTDRNTNYFLNSYDLTADNDEWVASGISYSGYHIATGGSGVTTDQITDTQDMPFPGFRCLGKGDTFTQAAPYGATDDEGNAITSYIISNLTISLAANVIYGVYDVSFENTAINTNASLKDEFISGNYKNILGMKDYSNSKNSKYPLWSDRANLLRGGALPLGLFAENLGTISNITLSDHIVRGIEDKLTEGVTIKNVNEIVATNMVGGFAGNNLGYISNLTLGEGSSVNGRTDVGGIIGRESYIVTDSDVNTATTDVTISGMKNYGTVSGLENVGGIVGRAYTHFIGEENQEKDYQESSNNIKGSRSYYYYDRYFITDNNTSMTGEKVARVKKITIADCSNRGIVAGDRVFGDGSSLKTDRDIVSKNAFIGGIAGVAMDGFIADNRSIRANAVNGNVTPLRLYHDWGYFRGEFSFIEINNCDSFTQGMQEDLHLNDYFVGGLAGYARYAYVTNCNTAPEDELYADGAPDCYVVGKRYVGGLFGCSDVCLYRKADDEDDYAVTNYNNVIGDACVGGIAGSTSIGDKTQHELPVWNPSTAGAFYASQYETSDTYRANNSAAYTEYISEQNMLNTGVVLGRKSSKAMPSKRSDSGQYQEAIGGIFGATRTPYANADNIQSEAVKRLAMKLITGDSETNLYTLNPDELQKVIDDSSYGGIGVGGITGMSLQFDWANIDGTDNRESKIDAVVYGQDYVGGFIGWTFYDAEFFHSAKNAYPYIGNDSGENTKGLLVAGRDGVGGLFGTYQYQNENTTYGPLITLKDTIDVPYHVTGRYGVGGLIGVINNNGTGILRALQAMIKPSNDTERIKVTGRAYVGGVAGVLDQGIHTNSSIEIGGMDISAKYFAGGLYGAIGLKGDYSANLAEVTGHKVYADSDVTVTADAFAGGVAGLYAGTNLSAFYGGTGGTLHKLIDSIIDQPYSEAYKTVLSNSTLKGSGTKAQTIAFSEYATNAKVKDHTSPTYVPKLSAVGNVEAKVFAGGLFGFVPDMTSTTPVISGYVNGVNVRTTEAVTGVSEAFDSASSYSYLGSVTGRIPSGVTVKNCTNLVSGVYSEGATSYYSSDKANWLGGLTEVNAGLITGELKNAASEAYKTDVGQIEYCINETDYDYSASATLRGVGAFAGVNGTKNTNGTSSGVITYCSNRAKIKAPVAAGISAAMGGNSAISYSENRGRILSSNASSGAAAGIAGVGTTGLTGKTVTLESCVNLGEINRTEDGTDVSGSGAGIVYSTGSCGDIEYCRNYGPGVDYAITAAGAKKVYANVEAGGLGADTENDPIAPLASDALKRNFYLYGEEPYSEPTSLDATGAVTATITGQYGADGDPIAANELLEIEDPEDGRAYYWNLYDKKPDGTFTWPSADYYPIAKKVIDTEGDVVGSWFKDYYDSNRDAIGFSAIQSPVDGETFRLKLAIDQPTAGLDADGIRIYFYNLNRCQGPSITECTYRYLVTLTFYDRYGARRTATNQRLIHLDSANYPTLDYFYDSIDFGKDEDGDPIKPVEIEIQFNPEDASDAYYVGITGLTYEKDGTETAFAGEASTETVTVTAEDIANYTEITNRYVEGESLVQSEEEDPDLWEYSEVKEDTWSKQLYVQENDTHERYQFIYKRHGVFQGTKLMTNSGYRVGNTVFKASVLNTDNTYENRIKVYEDIDKKLLEFLKDTTNYPDALFVGEN